jgi:dynein light chain roadblock-type
LSRIKTHKSVQGIIIINKEAAIIRTTYTGDKQEEGEQLAKAIHQLVLKAKSTVRELNKEVLY